MIVKTKKYQMSPKQYRKIAMGQIRKSQWWLPAALFGGVIAIGLSLFIPFSTTWVFYLSPIGPLLWHLFWWAQFMGATQMEQSQALFQNMSYEIDSRSILMKLPSKDKQGRPQGMKLEWDMIQRVEMKKEALLLVMGRGQFLYLPFSIFKSKNDRRFTESILVRKELIPEVSKIN